MPDWEWLKYIIVFAHGGPVQFHAAYGDTCGGIDAAAVLVTGLIHRQRIETSREALAGYTVAAQW
ncbi:MAG: hypothetical protein AAF458_22320 [Pseudomonadota bacterium]